MSTKKISTPAPGTQAVQASALNQAGPADETAGKQETGVDASVTPTEAPAEATTDSENTTLEAGKTDVEATVGTPVEDKTDDVQTTIQSLKASVEALTNQLQETKERLEAKERAEQRAIRLEKAGIPKALGSFIRDDADLESLSDVLSGLAKATPAGAAVPATPTLPTVGSKNPGGEILSIDEMIARAEANNDRAALSSLKLAKLSAASNMI